MGDRNQRPFRRSPAQQTQNVIEGLSRAAEIIDSTDLTLVLEPLNVLVSHPNYFVVTSRHAAQIIDGVGSAHVRILFDIFHQQISEGNLCMLPACVSCLPNSGHTRGLWFRMTSGWQ